MLRTEVILGFCEKTSFFTSRPARNCLVEAMKLDPKFGYFIKESMMGSTRFDSAEDFINCYEQFCSGASGGHS